MSQNQLRFQIKDERVKELLLRKSELSTYLLPYPKGESYIVSQNMCNWSNSGTNHFPGKYEEFSLDFSMPERSIVLAIEAGEVTNMDDLHKPGGKANFIEITHNDGTKVWYYHLYKGIRAEFNITIGSKVKKGQKIARSGNTGWSSGPHLHISHFDQNAKSMPTVYSDKFLLNRTYHGIPREFKTKHNKHTIDKYGDGVDYFISDNKLN